MEITWPSGLVQKFDGAQTGEWLNSYLDIKEGVPQAISVRPYAVAPNATAFPGNKKSPAIPEVSGMK